MNLCPKQGVYYNVPALEYHQWQAVSSSLLKNYAQNPKTCRDPFIASDDVNIGSGIHAYTLQGIKGLYSECAIMPMECEGTSKAAKEARATFAAQYPYKTHLPLRYGQGAAENKLPTMDVLQSVDDSFRNHPKTGPILSAAKVEVSLVWQDTQSGSMCKARLDAWDGKIIWDIKKTRDLDKFVWQIRDLEYYIQAAHYFNGAVACGLDPVAFGFLPCEAVYPFRVGCGYCDPDKLAEAQVNVERLIGLVAESNQTGNWPNFRPPAGMMSWKDLSADDLVEVY